MAILTFISETGMFHSLCKCTYPSEENWYGYAPIEKGSPHGPGTVHREARPVLVNHWISFDQEEQNLRAALTSVCAKYDNTTYTVTVHDCVSFSADVARACGLRVPALNFTPWGLIQTLRTNDYKELR